MHPSGDGAVNSWSRTHTHAHVTQPQPERRAADRRGCMPVRCDSLAVPLVCPSPRGRMLCVTHIAVCVHLERERPTCSHGGDGPAGRGNVSVTHGRLCMHVCAPRLCDASFYHVFPRGCWHEPRAVTNKEGFDRSRRHAPDMPKAATRCRPRAAELHSTCLVVSTDACARRSRGPPSSSTNTEPLHRSH